MNEANPDTREVILTAAFDLFYQHGFHAIGVDRIAKESGTTRQTLYTHFESKDEILLEVIKRRDRWWRRTFREEIQSRGGADPIARLRSVFDVLCDWFAGNSFNGCLFISAAAEFPSVKDPAHQTAKANVDAIRQVVTETAAAAGVEEPGSFAHQFSILIMGAIITEVVDRENTAGSGARAIANLLIDRHVGQVSSAPIAG